MKMTTTQIWSKIKKDKQFNKKVKIPIKKKITQVKLKAGK